MAFSQDVLVTALQELLKGYNETWTQMHPAFDKIVLRGNKGKGKHPYKEFGLVPEGPGNITDVGSDPDAFINGGRTQSGVKGNTYAATLIYAYDVPNQDLRDANGEADVIELIKRYPERALMDFHERLARQLIMGDGPDCGAFFTFNGDATYNPKGLGTRSGLFEFEDKSTQSNTIHGVAANSIVGWHSQYAHITSMGSDGLKKMRKAYWDASQQGSKAAGDVDLMFGDRDSYDNYADEMEGKIQFINAAAAAKGDAAPGTSVREGIPFHTAIFYPEPYIVRANFVTADAQDGVIYGVHSDTLHMYTTGTGSKETNGDFAVRDAFRLPFQDIHRHEIVFSAGMYCDNLRKNFSVTGGANP